MPTPQWKAPSPEWGFDKNATPDWFTVSHVEGWKEMQLDFGQGKDVKSVNPRIAKINDVGMDGQTRIFRIEGKNPGRTKIEVRNLRTKALESLLEVSVKSRRTLSISFHFVEDRGGNRTVRQPGIIDALIDDLNGIYDIQTSLSFQMYSFADIKLNTHLTDVVVEEKDEKTKSPTGEANIIGKGIWREIFAKKGDRLADFNVFFVPTDEPVNTNRNALPYTDYRGNCVIEDGREGLDMILPHAIGRMLGCPITNDLSHIQHLMFFDDTLRRSGNFIPKHCANIMNGSGS